MANDKISMLIKKTALLAEKDTNILLAPYELTGAQFRMLMFLYRKQQQHIRQTDLENAFGMTNPTVTGIINNLEKKGLVQRIENPDDRRSKLLWLTDNALEMIPLLISLTETIEKQMTIALTDDECTQLATILKKIIHSKVTKQ